MLEPLLPDRAVARRGGQWLDHRQVINGVLWRTRTGSPWRDLPGEFGNWKTVYMRHRRWSMDGTWERMLDELRRGCDAGRRLGPRALLLNWTLLLYTGAIANLGFDSSHYYAPLVTANTLLQAVGLAAALGWFWRGGMVKMGRKPR